MKALLRCGLGRVVVVAVAGLMAVGAGPAQAGTVYVSTAGNDANDGLGWSTAKKTVQAGLNAATSGDQVWVAAGTYVGCITLKAGVGLYGGFASTETDLSQRNWTGNLTVLDGNQAGSVVTAPAGAAGDTRIDGFTIRNGNGTLVGGDRHGGGIYCSSSSPTIANNTVVSNSGSASYGKGGGIYCSNSSPNIANNTIISNGAAQGGGIYCSSSSPTIANNTISRNTALWSTYSTSNGGGIYCTSSSPAIVNNTITGNTAYWKGGGICCFYGSPQIANNTITGNTAAVSNVTGSSRGCGGGIYCSSSSAAIVNNTITANSSSVGGGLYCGGAEVITNNTVAKNSAVTGGGICLYGTATVVNTIIAFNSSGIYASASATPSLRYNCVYGNAVYNYSGIADPTGTNGNLRSDPGLANASYGNVHLQPGAPCVDTGDDSVIQAGWTDMDGQARQQGGRVDIGADESDGSVWPSGPNVVIRVSPQGDDANDGLTWALAKRTVQAGIDATATAGGEVWVAAGTYVGPVTLRNFSYVYGGFAGVETQRSARDWTAHVTILDGGQSGTVVRAADLPGYALSTIDGFAVRNGNPNNAGIGCSSAAPTIANNTITGNGSGISCSLSCAMIVNNTIAGNSAPYGGGIRCSSVSSPAIVGNKIIANTGSSQGGGIHCASFSSAMILNNTIVGNKAGSAGAIYCNDSSSLTITNSIISLNSSGIYKASGTGTVLLRSNCVYGNDSYNYSGLTDPTGMDGNISADPRLADTLHGNMHIQPDSPCVDAGDDSAVQVCATDMDGQPRKQGVHVDIGADESDGTVWPQGPGVIVRVSPLGNDTSDGSSWTLAKRTVQASIDAAAATGGEVWVAAGIYPERITLRNFAHVYGGFAGTETDRSARDWSRNAAILDGGQGGSVVTATQIGPGFSTLDGFTIRNGNGTLINYDRYGGGIYCLYASPTIANNTITSNIASGTLGNGGGIYCEQSSSTIRANTIMANSAAAGGGIYCLYSSTTIVNNTIAANVASGSTSSSYGGGIFCFHSPSTIANNEIIGNSASSFAGGIYCTYESPSIANNTITNNSAPSGGGIGCYSAPLTIANTIIAFNSSGVAANGGSTLTLRSNCVYGNKEYGYSGTADPTGTNGNISVDPGLPGVAYRDIHIQPASPCIDAGDDSVAQGSWRDIDGQARIAGVHADIGADEFDGTVWPYGPNSIVRVSPLGSDANDGSSWTQAKRTVQAGIDATAAVGGEVWVQGGTYPERITLRSFSHVYGGFAGTEADRSARDWSRNATVLDGGQGGSVVTANQVNAGLCTLDGFTIRNGNATYGGGIYCSWSSPVLANNRVADNTGTVGGGIYCTSSSPTIANNTIASNVGASTSGSGGGIYCLGGSPVITGNAISGNSAASTGAGIYCKTSSPVIVNNTIVCNAAASSGGGIYFDLGSSGTGLPTVVNTIIAWNSSGICKTGTGTPYLRYNCVYGNSESNYSGLGDPTGVDGNVSTDPKLAAVSYGNVRVQPDSPCVDAGDDSMVQPGWSDLDGRARLLGVHVDIGACESDGTVWPTEPSIVVRVSSAGDDVNDGSSWVLAKRTVQAGIDATAAVGGEVWVQGGTYPEMITLRSFVHVYGGFAGTEAERSARQLPTQQSILDAGQAGSVVSARRLGHNVSTIDGFTIRNGQASNGGGIYISGSSLMIANNTLTANSGGAIFCSHGAPTITSNTITGNSGSGIYCSNSSPTITDNTITGNSATGTTTSGGGIYCTSSSPSIVNNTIAGNSADSGGGIYCASSSSARIANNRITGNSATSASGSGSGGGICCTSSSPTIVNNLIMDNRAISVSSSGYGGGIYCGSPSSPTIANNTIAGNRAVNASGFGYGGGIYSGGSPVILNNTIAGNIGAIGGGIHCSSGTATVVNSIIAFNSSGVLGSSTLALRSNCVYGNGTYNYSGLTDPTGANGNISADPKLAWPLYVDVHIQPDSPCVDAGDDSVVQPGWTDLDGQGRIQGGHADIGADESDGTIWPGGSGVVVRVRSQGDDSNDGSSWALAKRTVQAAVDAASPSGGQVWVAVGNYVESISVPMAVAVYGGFTGSEADLSGRNWTANQTVLDGSQTGNVVMIWPGASGATRVDGFTIRNGRVSSGWGVYSSYGSAAISNNTITANGGGGIYCSNGSPRITDNTITGNSGSGIYCFTASSAITGNRITGNTITSGSGAGIYCGNSSPAITNNTIIGNRITGSGSGAGIYCSSSSPVIANNRITGNSVAGSGGGIYCGTSSSARIIGNEIVGNVAASTSGSCYGGGIYCTSSSPTLANNAIVGNSAAGTSGYGGGLYCTASSSPTIANSTISANSAKTNGGGIYCSSSSPVIANAIIALNSSGIYKTGSGTLTLRYNCVYGSTSYNYSGLSDPTGTNGNISADPLFVRRATAGTDGIWGTADDDYGDLRLLPWSPCIDAGNSVDVPADSPDLDADGDKAEPLPLDLAGAARFLDDPQVADTGAGTPPIVDMGAYERCRPVGDVDGDWLTDVVDLLYMVDAFGTSNGDADYNARCDFNSDGTVDVVDLLDIVYNFGT